MNDEFSKIVAIDFLLTIILTYGIVNTKCPDYGILPKLIIAFGSGCLFIILNYIKIIGRIIQIICALFWTGLIMVIVPLDKLTNGSMPWKWGIGIVIFLVFLAVHIAPFLDEESYKRKTTNTYKYDPAYKMRKTYIKKDNYSYVKPQMSEYQHEVFNAEQFEHEYKMTNEVRSRISNTKNNLLNAEREFQIFKDKLYKVDNNADLIIEQYENNLKENKETLKQIEDQINFEPINIEKLQKMNFYLSLVDNFVSDIHAQYIDFKKKMNEENNKKNSSSNYRTDNTRDDTRNNTRDNTADMFFAGCNDKDSVTKRYRQLMKTFHPDNQNGDQGMTQNIQDAYEKMIKNMQ